MKHLKSYVLAFTFLPIILIAQKQFDSTDYYQKKIISQYKNAIKEVEESAVFKETQSKLIAYNKQHNNYEGWGINLNYSTVGSSNLNTSIASSGFKPFNNYGIGFGFLGNFKRGNALVDINLINFTLMNTAKNAVTNQQIKITSMDFLQTNIGYAIVNKQNFTLYPFVGFGLRSTSMILRNTQVLNASGNNISNYINTPETVYANSLKITYQVGLGMDVKISQVKNRAAFLFFKGGLNNTIGDEKFRMGTDFKFNPDMRIGGLTLQMGVKFAMYKTFQSPEIME